MKRKITFLLSAAIMLFLNLFSWPNTSMGQTKDSNNYTIEFNSTNGSDGSAAVSSISDIVKSGESYITSITDYAKIYKGKKGFGVKVGASGDPGKFTMNLSNAGQITVAKITIYAAKYGSDTGSLKITLNSNNDYVLTLTKDCLSSDIDDFEWDLSDNPIDIETIKVETTSKRAYLQKIIVEEESGDPSITVGANPPETINVNYQQHSSYTSGDLTPLAVTYENLTISQASDFAVQFYDGNGANPNELEDDDEGYPAWISSATVYKENSVYKLGLCIDENDGAERHAYLKVYADGGDDFVYSDFVTITQGAVPGPEITVSTTSLSDFTYNHNFGPSEYKSFTASGSHLKANVTASVPAEGDYQLCLTSGGTYGNSVTLPQTSGSFTNTTVYVKLKSGLAVGSHNGTITLSSTDAESKTVSLSGSVSGYTLTYNGNGSDGGTVPSAVANQPYNQSVTLSTATMTKTGHSFSEWNTEEGGGGTGYAALSTYYIISNATLYAKWTVNSYAYSIVKQGDNASNVTVTLQKEVNSEWTNIGDNPINYNEKVKVVVGNNSGYTFEISVNSGAVTVTEDNGEYFFNMPADAATVTVNTHKIYTVTKAAGLTNGDLSFSPSSGIAGTTVELTSFPAAGYMFNEWDVYETGDIDTKVTVTNNQFTMPEYDVTVSASFVERVATFTNGTYSEPITSAESFNHMTVRNVTGEGTWTYNSTYTCAYIKYSNSQEDWLITPKMPVEDGRLLISFMVWYKYPSNLALKWSNSLNGEWNDLSFSIGSASKWNTISNIAITTTEPYVYVAFVYTNSSTANAQYEIKSFTAKQQYKLSYDANGGSGSAVADVYYDYNTQVTAKAANTFTAPSGYAFKEWNTAADGSGTSYAAGASFYIQEGTTLYAQWGITHTISYPDGYTNGSVTTAPSSAFEGAEVTIVTEPEEHYHVTAMSATYETGGDPAVLSYTIDGDNITFTMPTNNVTISSITFSPTVHTVTYMINGTVGTGTYAPVNVGDGDSTTLPDDIDDIVVNEVTYAFEGWTADEGDIDILTGSYEPAASVTLYAVYSITAGVSYDVYKKLNSNPASWAGDYLIVSVGTYANSTNFTVAFDGGLKTLDATSNYINVTIENDMIEANTTTNAAKFTIASANTNYTIKSASGYYIGKTANSNGLNTSTTEAHTNSLSISSGVATITSSGGPTLQFNKAADQKRFRYYTSAQTDIQLYKKTTITPKDYYTRIYTAATTTATADITISGVTLIPSGKTLDMNGHTLNNSNPSNLIIEDGGQLILDPENTGVKATFKKNITATTSTKGTDNTHWYTISSPVTNTDGGVTITSVENLVNNGVSYNLYRLSTSSNNWESYNPTPTYHPDFINLEKGRGYLYRNNGMEVSFAGEVVVGNVTTYTLTTSYNEGFNLIGNPYGHSIYKGKGGAIDSENLNEGFYYLTNEGGWHAGTYETKIMPLMGILVKANTAGTIDITDTKATATAEKYANDELMFTVSNSQYEDVAYAMFKEGNGLTKIDHRNAEIPMLYISQNKENYSIALMSDETQAFNLNFKAMTTGKYTLSYKAKGNFSYLHVIDLLTGEDVDMLLDGEYSFIASPTDSDNRFIVRLGYLPDYSEGNDDIFAYQNGSDIYVSGEGELQVFDVTGRFVMSGRINGATSISADALSKGVYVLRIVGSEIKTQKIVVR